MGEKEEGGKVKWTQWGYPDIVIITAITSDGCLRKGKVIYFLVVSSGFLSSSRNRNANSSLTYIKLKKERKNSFECLIQTEEEAGRSSCSLLCQEESEGSSHLRCYLHKALAAKKNSTRTTKRVTGYVCAQQSCYFRLCGCEAFLVPTIKQPEREREKRERSQASPRKSDREKRLSQVLYRRPGRVCFCCMQQEGSLSSG